MIKRRLTIGLIALLAIGVTHSYARHVYAQTITLFGTAKPQHPIDSDTSAVTLGVQFYSSQAGTIAGVRFYRASRSSNGYSVGIFDASSGARLAFASKSKEPCASLPCWEQINFSSPLSISANKTYVAAYFVSGGHYAGDTNYFTNQVVSGPLTAPATGAAIGGNGVYIYGSSLLMPNSTYQASNYYVDVSFTPSAPPPPNLVMSFNPAAPAIPDTSPIGTNVAAVNVDWSDDVNGSHPFAGTLGFAQPYSNDAGTFNLSGGSLVVASTLGSDGGTTQNVTVQATQSASSVTKNLPIQVTHASIQTPTGVSFSPAGPVGVADNAAPGTFLANVNVTTSDNQPFSGAVTISAQSAPGMTALSAAALPSSVLVSSIGASDDGPQTVSVQACENGTCASPGILGVTVSPPSNNSALLPSDRDASANWKMAGMLSKGGIPTRTSVCATLTATNTTADAGTIQNAIDNCPAGGVVLLNAGTFNLNSACVNVNRGITLRGAGAGKTILAVTNGSILGDYHSNGHNSCVVAVGSDGNISNTANLTSDGVQGAYTVNVASTAGIAVGSLVLVDELAIGQAMPDCCLNGGTGKVWAEPDYRVEWNAHSPSTAIDSSCVYGTNNFACGTNGDECAYSGARCGGVNEELHLVSAISGNTVTFDSPLALSYRTAKTAQIHVYSQASIAQNAGVENLSMWGGDNGNLVFGACVYCWAKNIESYQWLNQGGIYFGVAAFRDQADTFWVHNAAWPVNGGGGYAINLTHGASEEYIVNGISMLANKVIVMRASGSGTVVSYNYMDDGYINGSDTWVETGLNCSHLVGSHHALFEGNQSFNIDSDFTHGASPYCTYFRNYITGFREKFTALDGTVVDDSTGCCGPQRALASHPYTYWTSFIGNVAGMPGKMTGWQYRNNAAFPSVLALGWDDFNLNSSQGGPSEPDAAANTIYPATPTGVTAAGCMVNPDPCTTIVDGNYDYLTNSIHWASNDSAHVLPNSLYLAGKPEFFTGQSSVWPPVDPIGAVVNNIPAHARWAACQPNPTAACIFTQQ